MPKESIRYFLPGDDIDNSLVDDQMRIKTVEGFLYRFREGVPIDPSEVLGISDMRAKGMSTEEIFNYFSQSID